MALRPDPRRKGVGTRIPVREPETNGDSDEADKFLASANESYQLLIAKEKKVSPERLEELRRFVHTF